MISNSQQVRRFVLRASGFLLIQAIIALVVFITGTPGESNHYLATMQDKVARLQSCDGPRIVMIGGSNVAFGIHSDVMEEETGIPTVNLGLNAALGLPFLMDCYQNHARPGDIVVLCPEYHLLSDVALQQGDPQMMDELVSQWPGAKQYMAGQSEFSWKQFLDRDALWLAHQWVGRSYRRIRNKDTSGKIYYRSSFNELCDVVAHRRMPRRELQPVSPVPAMTKQTADVTAQLLNEFATTCRQRGVTVYFSYPPFMEKFFEESKEAIDDIHRVVETRVEIPVINGPEKFALPIDQFFDSGYHLSAPAGEERSRFIARAIADARGEDPTYRLARGPEQPEAATQMVD